MRVDPLLIQYPIRIREVTIGVILGISILFYTLPRFLGESEKVEYDIVQEIETFDIPQTEQIKLPEFTTLNMTAPIMATIFAIFFLNEKLNFYTYLCLTIGFIGVIFVIQPGFESFNVYYILVLVGVLLITITQTWV